MAALRGVILSVKKPKSGRPKALKIANTPTSVAAVSPDILIISLPTGLEIPIAISPAIEPMRKQKNNPQNVAGFHHFTRRKIRLQRLLPQQVSNLQAPNRRQEIGKAELRTTRIIPKAIPKYMKVVGNPTDGIRTLASLPVIRADPPKPASIKPTARPFLSGNHFAPMATGQP